MLLKLNIYGRKPLSKTITCYSRAAHVLFRAKAPRELELSRKILAYLQDRLDRGFVGHGI